MSEQAEDIVAEQYEPRLKAYYSLEVVPQLMDRFGFSNRLSAPRLEKA